MRHVRYDLRWNDSSPEPYRLLWIDPDEIEYLIVPSIKDDLITRGTHVIGGDWDRTIVDTSFATYKELVDRMDGDLPVLAPFSRYGFYRAIRSYLLEGEDWTETEYYQSQRTSGVSASKLERYRRSVDDLYDSIVTNGYKTQAELPESARVMKEGPPEYDEIRVNIARDGTFVLDDCRNRLSIAKLLELDEVPVRVLVRHKRWQEIRETVATVDHADELSDEMTRLLDHPDLQDVISESATATGK
ncbi:hypothetical protein [Halostagnicola bangensis]